MCSLCGFVGFDFVIDWLGEFVCCGLVVVELFELVNVGVGVV